MSKLTAHSAATLAESCPHGGPVVGFGEPDERDIGPPGCDVGCDAGGAVGGPVLGQDDVALGIDRCEFGGEALDGTVEEPGLVVDRDDDGDGGLRHGGECRGRRRPCGSCRPYNAAQWISTSSSRPTTSAASCPTNSTRSSAAASGRPLPGSRRPPGSLSAAIAGSPSPGWPRRSSRGSPRRALHVDDLGMITTDMVYYAAGALDEPGVMITASHNPKGYNGIKLCLAGAAPVGVETGLDEIKAMAAGGPPAG